MKSAFRSQLAILLLSMAVACTGYGQAQEAQACSNVSALTPTYEQAANLLRAELIPAADCSVRAFLKIQPTSANAHYLLGYILNRRGDADSSLREYTKASTLRKPQAQDLAVVALDYVLLKDNEDAEKWMMQALLLNPKNVLYWYYLGRIRYHRSAFDDAGKAFEEALRIAPNDLRALYNLGLTFEALGNDDRATEIYQQAISEEHASQAMDAQPYYDLGSLLARHNEPARALPLLEQAAKFEPRNAGIRERLAKVEETLGDLAGSKQDLEAAIVFAPEMRSLHFELGHVEQRMHLIREAKEQFVICANLRGGFESSDEGILNFTRAK